MPFDRVEPGSQPCLVARCPQATPETHGESHGGLSRGRAGREGGPCDHRGAWKGALPDSGVLESLGSVGNPFVSSSSYDVSEDEITSGRDPCVWILFPLPPSPFAVIAGKKCVIFVLLLSFTPRSRALESTEVDERWEDLELCTRFEIPPMFPDHLLFCLSTSQQ